MTKGPKDEDDDVSCRAVGTGPGRGVSACPYRFGRSDNPTLIPLLRISIFCHFGSTCFVLPIRPKDGILNRGIRVGFMVSDLGKKPFS